MVEVDVPDAPTEGESYTLDPEGNRLTSHLSPSHDTDAANRLTSDADYSYVYDLNGNLITKTPQPGSTRPAWAYRYDALDQLIAVEKDGITVERYRYDAFGRRSLIETADGAGGFDTLAIVNDGSDRTIDITQGPLGQAIPLRRYTHGAQVDEPLSVETFDAAGNFEDAYTYHTDHLGSVRFLTDGTGQVVNVYDYDSYGRVTAELEVISQPFRYTAREWDAATELYHYRARAYDPTTGRFWQEDPIGFDAGDLNIYRYVGGNPVGFTDPTGLSAASYVRHAVNGAIGGAAIGVTFSGVGCGFGILGDIIKNVEFSIAVEEAKCGVKVLKGAANGARDGALGGVAFKAASPLISKIFASSFQKKNFLGKTAELLFTSKTYVGRFFNTGQKWRIGIERNGGKNSFRAAGTWVQGFKRLYTKVWGTKLPGDANHWVIIEDLGKI